MHIDRRTADMKSSSGTMYDDHTDSASVLSAEDPTSAAIDRGVDLAQWTACRAEQTGHPRKST